MFHKSDKPDESEISQLIQAILAFVKMPDLSWERINQTTIRVKWDESDKCDITVTRAEEQDKSDMTRKVYIRLAKDIRYMYDFADDSDKLVILRMVGILCNSLKEDNPRFDREKFIYAATGT